jgi:hypothetical protein
MTDTTNDEFGELPDELTTLKSRADLLGITYHPSIGLEKLREKVTAALADKPAELEPVEAADPAEETESQTRTRLRQEANKLMRIRVACMNPDKKEWDGELFTTGNSVVGTFTKFVPFNNEEGWHVPQIIYKQLAQKQCQIFVSDRDARGNTIRKSKLIKEFSIEILPDLTQDELQELARRQALSRAID